jgi:vacuolar-type H+-ATPase subunit E/Vma4
MSNEDAEVKISQEILADAHSRAERALKAAQREADTVSQRAKEEAKTIEQNILGEARRRADTQVKIIQASVEPARRRLILDEREKTIKGVIDEAKTRLLKREGAEYEKFLVSLAVDAARSLGGGGLAACLAHTDVEKFKARLPQLVAAALKAGGLEASIVLRPASEPIDGGVIIETVDGLRRVDNSIDARLRRAYPEVRRKLAEMLYK